MNEEEKQVNEIVIRPVETELAVRKNSCMNKLLNKLSDEQRIEFNKWVEGSATRFAEETAMICNGRASPCQKRCPFTKEQIWPKGEVCPMESMQKAERVFELCEELKYESLGFKSSEFRTILSIVELEILQDTIVKELKDRGVLVDDVKITRELTIHEKKAHPLFDKLFKVIQTRKELLESLLGTRKSQAEAMAKFKPSRDMKKKIRVDYEAVPTLEELENFGN